MKHHIFVLLSLLLFLAACGEDAVVPDGDLTVAQQELLGTAVRFDASVADPFTTRTSYDHSGGFNEEDIMTIYRQYYDSDLRKFDNATEVFRVYHYSFKYATGSDIKLGIDWLVADGKTSAGASKKAHLDRQKGEYSASAEGRALTLSQQSEADSLTWENGKTVRFRAWSRSNLAGVMAGGSKSLYYPDYQISDWVNVSGPTLAIPLTLKHVGCRIDFSHRNMGNQLVWVEISTDPEDYARPDNADTQENDDADRFPKEVTFNGETKTLTAEEAAAEVRKVYERMCMPAGVDIENGTLRSMTKAAYDATEDFSHLEEWAYDAAGQAKLVNYNTRTPQQIIDEVQRPLFTRNMDTHCYLITIPYDISNDHDMQGDLLTLPPWTRFRVYLYDVNQGDETYNPTLPGNTESQYHLLSLDDVINANTKEKVYPNGLEMKSGYSYEFRVGYRYGRLHITPGEDPSWIDQDATLMGEAIPDVVEEQPATQYAWWKAAITDAIPRGTENFNPEFHITSEEQFLEFIKLVNGTAGAYGVENKIYHLVKEYTTITNSNGTISKVPKSYGWSRTNDERNPVWVEKEELETEGFVFYEHYYPTDGDKAAYSVEDYLQGPYSFFDSRLNRHFTVYLDRDLDFKDVLTDAVGTADNRFGGYFDGCPSRTVRLNADSSICYTEAVDPRIDYETVTTPVVHTIKNLNVNGNYLFGYVCDAAIRNLTLESYHPVGLLNTANPSMDGEKVLGWGCYLVGIAVRANNSSVEGLNALAHSLVGQSYVVGCLHDGEAGGALVGTADNLLMYGCMRTADNRSDGALLGQYANSADRYLKPQISLSVQRATKNFSEKPSWSRFMCNYYNKDIREASQNATAIGGIADDYSPLEYIRGRASRILCAQNDNLLSKAVNLSQLTVQQQEEYYGLAPWKAMNYAIWYYNSNANLPGKSHPCKAHYQVSSIGYDHTYPQLVSGAPTDDAAQWNVLQLKN